MVREAESHSAEDKQRRELVDLRNQADTLGLPDREAGRGQPGQAREDEARAIEQAVADARKAAEGEDAAAIRSALEALTRRATSSRSSCTARRAAPRAQRALRPRKVRTLDASARRRRGGRRVHGQG